MTKHKRNTSKTVQLELDVDVWRMLKRIAKLANVTLDQVVNVIVAMSIEAEKRQHQSTNS